jgi:hypothetical protein
MSCSSQLGPSALIMHTGEKAASDFLEFFTVNILYV